MTSERRKIDIIAQAETESRKHLFLLEHETYGDEAACVIVDENASLLLSDVWNSFSDYEDTFENETVIGLDDDE